MADANTYEPGPSFVENDRPVERLTEMPAWLQTFAAQEDTRNEIAGDEPEDAGQADVEAVAVDDSGDATDVLDHDDQPVTGLPDWLTGDAGESSEDDNERAPDYPDEALLSFDDPDDSISASSFIDEDDLPDWLRAFSEESSVPPPSPAVSTFNPTHQAPSTGAVAIRVPPVESIWLPAYERRALGPGGTLFAMLASNTNGVIAHEEQSDTGEPGSGHGTTDRSQGTIARRTVASGDDGGAEAAPQSNSMRILLLTLLVVALVILISFLFFS